VPRCCDGRRVLEAAEGSRTVGKADPSEGRVVPRQALEERLDADRIT